MPRKSAKLVAAEQAIAILTEEVAALRDKIAQLQQEAKPAVDASVMQHAKALLLSGKVEEAQRLLDHGQQGHVRMESWGPGDPVKPGSLRDGWRQQELRKRLSILWQNENLRPGGPEMPGWCRPDSTEPIPEEWLARIDPAVLETGIEDYSEDGVLILDRNGARFTDGNGHRRRRARPEDEKLVRRTVVNNAARSHARDDSHPAGDVR